MKRLFVPTLGPTDWRRLLADPETQWEPGKSALEMAVAWEAARRSDRGLPQDVADALDSSPDLSGAKLVIGLPEHEVTMTGGGHASKNDLWTLLRKDDHFFSMAVEAKAGEPLDDYVQDWLTKSQGRTRKPERLRALQERLGLVDRDVLSIRYQLLHRAASALIEADRFKAKAAILLIQSFNREEDAGSWDDCLRFGEILEMSLCSGQVGLTKVRTTVPLYFGWVSSQPASEERLRSAL
jgi:hypothetical protein